MAKKEWRQYRYVPIEEQESIDEIGQRNLKAMREGKIGRKPPHNEQRRLNKHAKHR